MAVEELETELLLEALFQRFGYDFRAYDRAALRRGLAAARERHAASGGKGDLDRHFEIEGGMARLLPELRRRITWSRYSLATDASFNEFQAILCRGALGDFGPVLRQRVLRLFHDSLARCGLLNLDRPLAVTDAHAGTYLALEGQQAWYKRVG